jgi:hypothetical protein
VTKEFGALVAAAFCAAAAGAALAARVHLVVRPATVAPGAVVTVSAGSSPCLTPERVAQYVTLISAAFPGHAFGGEGAVRGRIGSRGSFSVHARVRLGLRRGRYPVTARCGGGNLGVSASIRVS